MSLGIKSSAFLRVEHPFARKFEIQICSFLNIKVVKIITGHGSGVLRNSVRKWLQEQEGRFQAVINGEDYNMFNTLAADMRSECYIKDDFDFGKGNSAITFVWLW